jgi:hypothetical protein
MSLKIMLFSLFVIENHTYFAHVTKYFFGKDFAFNFASHFYCASIDPKLKAQVYHMDLLLPLLGISLTL